MSNCWDQPVRKPSDGKKESENIAKVIDSGNSTNELNVWAHADADTKSAVKADAEQEQEQRQFINEEG
ncbi:hypothetical protein HF072_05000 [Bacillus sp. RO3]|nr:hypothetical protein [Bacillus sp. RO3]